MRHALCAMRVSGSGGGNEDGKEFKSLASNSGWQVFLFRLEPLAPGTGAMCLPIQGGSQSPTDRFDPNKPIDEEATIKMIEYTIIQGVNYFDTAYVYHGEKSEPALGKALKGYRDKVMLATKLPVMLTTKREDFDRFLDEQLKKLDTNYLDVYLLHGLNRQNWVRMKELGVPKFLDQIQADSRARNVGFSFHDDVRIFKEIVDSYD